MESLINYPGTKWYKCDLHLHTTESECFEDKSVTPEQWVARAIERGLDCVAITDHNSGAGIDSIINAAKGQPITVFPGVEITCDSSKVHLLLIFEKDKNTQDVEDFLLGCEIKRNDFGKSTAHSSLRIQDIIEKAGADCIVIPAHVDQYSGLSNVSHDTIKTIYESSYINAIQIVHKEFLENDLRIQGNITLQTAITGYYGQEIAENLLKDWYRPIKLALAEKMTLLTFSDNPMSATSSKHGLDGIGDKYTWIKMEEIPNLESLRQAFLLPDLRVRNCYNFVDAPYEPPELWIRHILIYNTEVTSESEPLIVEFNPQMNTIIGGRGSGKSGILRFIRGLFNRTSDISDDILKDHEAFYKKCNKQVGVFREDSKLEILFERQGILYCLKATNINNSSSQSIEIQKFISGIGWEKITNEGFIDFFEFEQYSQKQIYDIAQNPHYLRDRIDDAAEGMDDLKREKDTLIDKFLEISTKIRTAKSKLAGKGKLETEINDLADSIKAFDESSISTLLSANKRYRKEEKIIDASISKIGQSSKLLAEIIPKIEIPKNNFTDIDTAYQIEIKDAYTLAMDGTEEIQGKLICLHEDIKTVESNYNSAVEATQWKKDFSENNEKFEAEKESLLEKGVDEIDNYEKLSSKKEEKEEVMESLSELESELEGLQTDKEKILDDYVETLNKISLKRKKFVEEILKGENVKIIIKTFRDKDSFEQQIRDIIERETEFQPEVDRLIAKVFNGLVTTTIKDFRKIIKELNQGSENTSFGGHFKNRINKLTPAQIDHLILLMPEDEISILYKPAGVSSFKPLTTASAGQKTTAVLTFIMSYGDCPLILDQPEDDLDNRLVYELVVDRLKKAKEKRQVIVVTHNANIPVNGDAEHVISMDSDSKYFNVFAAGSVDQPLIKKEICDVMEGTEYAFNMRAKRYQGISK